MLQLLLHDREESGEWGYDIGGWRGWYEMEASWW